MSWIASWLKWLGPNRSVAARGEKAAAKHLRREGYRILGRNLRNRFGEIDILAQTPDKRTIVIVEVKAAGTANPTYQPEIHVTHQKQRKLTALAGQIARQYRLTNRPIRFDVIGVDLPDGQPPIVRHHLGAFQSHV